MFNAATKLIAFASIISLSVACTTDKYSDAELKASNLLGQAEALDSLGQYQQAIELLDSIDNTYPTAVNTRNSAKKIRPQIMERYTVQAISTTDSLFIANQQRGIELRQPLRYVKNMIEGYYVYAGTEGVDVQSTPGLHGRVSADYKLYVVASYPQHNSATRVALRSGDDQVVSESVPYDGERNARHGSCQSITFTEAQSVPLGEFMSRHREEAVQMVFIDNNGREWSYTVPEKQKKALADLFEYHDAMQRDKVLRLEQERLARQLDLVRKQIGNVNMP